MHSERLIPLGPCAFGPFSVDGGAHAPLLRAQPMDLDDAGAALLAMLVRAAGAVVDAATLAAVAGRAEALWDRIAALNAALAQRGNEAGYVAHYPGQGYALVLAGAGQHGPQCKALPEREASVVERDGIVEAIGARLLERRFVTIVGAGGIGKTTVATVLAARLGADFPDGVCFVDLAPLADAHLLPLVLAAALGISVVADAPWQGLANYLRDKRVLVLFDCCEHMIDAAASGAEHLLRAAPALHLLATSREPLLASGEWLYRLGAMALPPVDAATSAAAAASYAGVALFVARAGTDALPFVLDAANVAQVCALCRQLDGIPLAIELAAARVATLGLARLSEGIAERLLQDARTVAGAPGRHRTLAAMLDWSYDLLPPQEQRALVQLALFRGEFTLAAAVSLLADPALADPRHAGTDAGDDGSGADSVIELVSKSLLTRRDAGGDRRYRLLDTTRAYAGAKLDASGARARLLASHADFLCRLLEASHDDWLRMARGDWLERYTVWIDDIRVALDWALAGGGDRLFGMRLAAAAYPLGHQASLTAEFGERIRFALTLGGDAGPHAMVLKSQMQALLCSVHSRSEDGGEEAMRRVAEDIDGLHSDCPPPHYRIALATAWWSSAFLAGEFPTCRARGELLMAHAAASGDAVAVLVAQRLQVQTLHFLGEHAESRRLAAHVLANAACKVPLTYNPSQVDVRVSMGNMRARGAWIEGFPDRARAIAAEALAHAEGDAAVAVAQVLAISCIPTALWCGDDEQAARFLVRLAEHTARHSFDHWANWGAVYADVLAVRGGDAAGSSAAAAARARLALPATRANDKIQRDHLVTYDTRLLAADSLARADAGVVPWCVPEVLRAQAGQRAQAGDLDAAAALLARALALAARQGALGWQLRSAIALVRLERQRGDASVARAGLAALLARFTEGFNSADLREAASLV